jgi:hypothetical protein
MANIMWLKARKNDPLALLRRSRECRLDPFTFSLFFCLSFVFLYLHDREDSLSWDSESMQGTHTFEGGDICGEAEWAAGDR